MYIQVVHQLYLEHRLYEGESGGCFYDIMPLRHYAITPLRLYAFAPLNQF